MIFQDTVYGKVEVKEPVLLKLLESRPVQRLKGIDQRGATVSIEDCCSWYTRFDHSLGVMLLLRQLGASLEEQAAGLLHDVSHTAFSHAIDHGLGNKADDFHERFFGKVVMGSEIPDILRKHSMRPEVILDEKNFTLLERDLPSICADRLDYSYRDMVRSDTLGAPAVQENIRALVNHDGELVFRDMKSAMFFGLNYLRMGWKIYNSPLVQFRCQMMGKAMKAAMEKGIITEADLFSMTDKEVYSRLLGAKDKEIGDILEMKGCDITPVKEGKHDVCVIGKVRAADPKFLEGGKPVALSEASKGFSMFLEKTRAFMERGSFLMVIR
jgi:HD superfamily phosphohydrolase